MSDNKSILEKRWAKGFIPPFRVGRKQMRVILDSRGYQVAEFPFGQEQQAQLYCDFLNGKDLSNQEQREKELVEKSFNAGYQQRSVEDLPKRSRPRYESWEEYYQELKNQEK